MPGSHAPRGNASRPGPAGRARRLAFATAMALAATPGGSATAGPASARGSTSGARERAATALVGRARAQAFREHPACAPRLPAPRRPAASDEPVPAALSSLLGILRRPQTAAEHEQSDPLFPLGLVFRVQLRAATRIATAPDGTKLTLLAGRTGRAYVQSPKLYDACQRLLRARLRVLASSQPPAVARRALAIQKRQAADGRPRRLPPYSLFLAYGSASAGAGGGSGGPFDPEAFRQTGLFETLGTRSGTRVHALVPDGVAAVSVRYLPLRTGARVVPGLDFTERVAENVLSYAIGRPPERGLPSRMLFRRADGSRIGGWRTFAGESTTIR